MNLNSKIQSSVNKSDFTKENKIVEERVNLENLKNQTNLNDSTYKKVQHNEIFNILNTRKIKFYDLEEMYLNK